MFRHFFQSEPGKTEFFYEKMILRQAFISSKTYLARQNFFTITKILRLRLQGYTFLCKFSKTIQFYRISLKRLYFFCTVTTFYDKLDILSWSNIKRQNFLLSLKTIRHTFRVNLALQNFLLSIEFLNWLVIPSRVNMEGQNFCIFKMITFIPEHTWQGRLCYLLSTMNFYN